MRLPPNHALGPVPAMAPVLPKDYAQKNTLKLNSARFFGKSAGNREA
jgi:hypothetical protein